MKIRLLLALVGLAIGFALPTFAQEKNAVAPEVVVLELLTGRDVICLTETKEGHSIHPLCFAGATAPKSYKPNAVTHED
jgi:hypothetical protein